MVNVAIPSAFFDPVRFINNRPTRDENWTRAAFRNAILIFQEHVFGVMFIPFRSLLFKR